MNKHFLSLFSLFSLIAAAAAALVCMTCHLHTETDHCRRGFGVCVAQRYESCMNLKIFKNNTLQLTYAVCQKFCKNLIHDYNNRTYIYTCCYKNYCNFEF